MKIKLFYFLIIAACFSCGHKHDPAPDPNAVQLGKLSGTWNAKSATLNGVAQTGYTNFQLVLAGQVNAAAFSYEAKGRPSKSSWPANGAWTFGDPLESVIIRDKGTGDEVTVNYAVTDHDLTLTFTYSGAGYSNSRLSTVKGQWAFSFSNQ